jgi:acetyltransferase-like isoleucine patch superfamily enzyme
MKIGKIEALNFIENDRIDFMEYHKGFLCEGDLPFRPPIHKDTIIMWPPVDIHPSAKIGSHVMIGRFTNICGDIEIGDYTRIQGFCFIPDSVKIGKYVFIGPNVTFTNVKRPRVRDYALKERDGVTIVEDEARIGAGAVILPGIRIGSGALVGAGAVVTKDVKPNTTVVGNPAKELI